MTRGGLPHSDIFGSKLVCSSPKLFAACHVLHRLLAPRHSPYTLSSLTIRNSKLTLTNRLHVDWSATVPCNTACVVVGKNYRLQNIQLSKISLPGTSRQSVYVGCSIGARRSSRALRRSRPTSVRERPRGLTHSPKLFQRALVRPPSLFELRWTTFAELACQPKLAVSQRAKVGGEYRARTGDLLVANQALSQLS